MAPRSSHRLAPRSQATIANEAINGTANVVNALDSVADITNQHCAKCPGKVASGEVGRADEQWHEKELGTKHVGVIVVTKRKMRT